MWAMVATVLCHPELPTSLGLGVVIQLNAVQYYFVGSIPGDRIMSVLPPPSRPLIMILQMYTY